MKRKRKSCEEEEYKEEVRAPMKRQKVSRERYVNKQESKRAEKVQELTMRELLTDRWTSLECCICGIGSETFSDEETPLRKGIRELSFVKLDCCIHTFCFDCIYECAMKTSNNCPMCRAEFWSLTRPAHPLQAPLKIHLSETVYLHEKRQAVTEHVDLQPDPPSDLDLLSFGEISESQETLD